MAVAKDYRLMLKTVYIVRPVISRTLVRTLTGCVLREVRDQHTMECEPGLLTSQSTAVTSPSVHACQQVIFQIQF